MKYITVDITVTKQAQGKTFVGLISRPHKTCAGPRCPKPFVSTNSCNIHSPKIAKCTRPAQGHTNLGLCRFSQHDCLSRSSPTHQYCIIRLHPVTLLYAVIVYPSLTSSLKHAWASRHFPGCLWFKSLFCIFRVILFVLGTAGIDLYIIIYIKIETEVHVYNFVYIIYHSIINRCWGASSFTLGFVCTSHSFLGRLCLNALPVQTCLSRCICRNRLI